MEGALLVEVRGDGLRLSGETVSLAGLASKVRQRLARKPGQKVLVRPASGVALQETVAVLDRLAAAGVANMSVIRGRTR
jgi:biopolymer transport protein ExbD